MLPPAHDRYDVRQALWALADELRDQGLDHLYARASRTIGVLSVRAGLTVWSNGRILRWHQAGQLITWPAADPQGAARRMLGTTNSRRHGAPE